MAAGTKHGWHMLERVDKKTAGEGEGRWQKVQAPWAQVWGIQALGTGGRQLGGQVVGVTGDKGQVPGHLTPLLSDPPPPLHLLLLALSSWILINIYALELL